jgi:hypothetical protein
MTDGGLLEITAHSNLLLLGLPMICEVRRRVAAALCRYAFRIQPNDQPIVIYDGMGAWPFLLPTLEQQAFMDWVFSDAERTKREQELLAYQQSRAKAAELGGAIGLADSLVAEIAVDAHLGAKIVGADQQHVNPGYGCDLFGIGDSRRRLQHDDRQIGGIERGGRLPRTRRAQPVLRPDTARRAMADRRVFEPVDNLFRLGGGVDMRHDDAERAIIERPGGDRVLTVRHPRDRRDAGIECGGRDLRAGLERMTPFSMSRESQSKPATAMALAISTLRVMRPPTPSDSWLCRASRGRHCGRWRASAVPLGKDNGLATVPLYNRSVCRAPSMC